MVDKLTFKPVGLVVAAALLVAAASLHAMAKDKFASVERAFTKGQRAYRERKYDIAVPALKFAADRGAMPAKFFLAKIYSDNGGGWTNHPKAYGVLREIIKGYWNVDPEDHRVAPYVSQALTSIARYERDGIPSHLKPSMQRALEFFEDAASYFNNKYAQFELANHYLAGDGVKGRVPHGLHWLANLTKRGHVGAQAFLATLHRDGRHVMRDGVMALAFITMAVENDKEKNRLIEDLHRNIFCDATAVTRRSARQRVFNWRKRYVEMQILPNGANELGPITPETQRTCANGDVVPRKMSNQPLRRQRQVEPTWKFGPTRSKTMKTRPNRNRSKLKSLNGFGSQEDLRPRQKKPRRDLNGFISRRER